MIDPSVPLTEQSVTPPSFRHDPTARLRPVNWNRVTDEKDLEVWICRGFGRTSLTPRRTGLPGAPRPRRQPSPAFRQR